MVIIEVLSCGRWQSSRFDIMSVTYAAAMIANLAEQGISARSVPA